MEASKIAQKFKENRWYQFGALIPALMLLVLVFFLVKSWLAPREPEIPSGWHQEIVGYWAFEKPEGQQINDVAGNLPGQLGDSLQVDNHDPERAGGKLGSSLKFEGEDYALVPYDASFNLDEEISLEAWVKPQASSANEDLWLSGWKYRKGIIIENDSRNSFEDTQVKLVMDTQSLIKGNKLQSDCKDLRFTNTDKTTKLDWFIEEGCNSTTTEIWVKVPYLEKGKETPIYAYYGNLMLLPKVVFTKLWRHRRLKVGNGHQIPVFTKKRYSEWLLIRKTVF